MTTTVFFDRTSGKSIPHALQLLGVAAEAHLDHFAHDERDDVWLAAVGRRGWIVVTNDKRIRFNESERRAVIEHNVGCFVLTSGTRTKWEQMQILVKAWAHIQQLAAETPRPFIFSIHATGMVEMLYPTPARPMPHKRRRRNTH